jgi:hypothetical protein
VTIHLMHAVVFMFSVSEPQAPVTFTKEYGCKEQLVAAIASAKVVETFETNVEKATNEASCASSPSKKCLPVVRTGKKTFCVLVLSCFCL